MWSVGVVGMWRCFVTASVCQNMEFPAIKITIWNLSEMAGPVVLVTSASGRIGKEVIARLKSLGR